MREIALHNRYDIFLEMPAELDNSVSGTEVSTLTDLAKDVLPYYSTEINKQKLQQYATLLRFTFIFDLFFFCLFVFVLAFLNCIENVSVCLSMASHSRLYYVHRSLYIL